MGEPGRHGPLQGVRVVELAGIGPGPFCAMLLGDLGAEVVRVDRVGGPGADYTPNAVLERGRRSVAVDLKSAEGVAVVLRLIARTDVLVESFRPGVTERLGLGPSVCLARNPRLVYGRLSGYGQDGPWSGAAGHDLNYVSLTGALHAIGRPGERPVPPLNLIGDFGGGASSLALGIVSALLAAARTGEGCVVDGNVLDGTNALMGLVHGLRAAGRWNIARGANLLDGGCPYYDTYTCSDGRWVAVATIERRFFVTMLDGLGLGDDEELLAAHGDRTRWARLRSALTAAFASRPRDAWAATFGGVDACVTPVLDLDEAVSHPQAVARGSYAPTRGLDGTTGVQPVVSPRFGDATAPPVPPPLPPPPRPPGADTRELLREAGLPEDEIAGLLERGVVAVAEHREHTD